MHFLRILASAASRGAARADGAIALASGWRVNRAIMSIQQAPIPDIGRNGPKAADPSGLTLQRGFASGSTARRVLKLGFVGAGGINFGTPEGPWNHAAKLEKFKDVEFSAIVDPNTDLANQRIADLQRGKFPEKWSNTKVFPHYQELLDSPERPDALFIGLPPSYHGSIDDPKADIELQLAKAGMNLFVEKPLSVKPVEEVDRLSKELKSVQAENGVTIAVGYMLRYSPAVEAAKRILDQQKATPVAVLGRYAGAYTHIRKRDWWDISLCGGPIIEQATHFVDLMRYLVGDIKKDSIETLRVGPHQMLLNDMAKPPMAEHPVPMERRVNRATTSIFQFENGLTIGSLTHTILLHEMAYHTAIEVVCDGTHVLIEDPYGPRIGVQYRLPQSNEYHQAELDLEHDMYEAQFRDFLHAVRTGDKSGVRSLYHDAVKTYETTRWITDASNKHFKA